jgi:hypothetical protein
MPGAAWSATAGNHANETSSFEAVRDKSMAGP